MIRRRQFLTGFSACAAACAHSETPGPAAHADGKAELGVFFAALRGLEGGGRKTPVNVLQIGDSHTANDGFSGRMRELFQQRFGNAGRGLLPPGIPFRLYKADGVHVTQDGFAVVSSFPHAGPGPFGISGLRQHADGPGSMILKVDQPGDLAEVEIEFVGGPGAGLAHISFDAGPDAISPTSAPGNAPVFLRLAAPRASQLALKTYSGSADMLSWRIGRGQPGVTWSNLGTIGATVSLVERWDPALVRNELSHANPSLIVLAFGSNEGFSDTTNLDDYPSRYRAAIEILRNGAPGASVLLLGPPDGVRHPSLGAGTMCPGGVWQQPENLAKIRELQRNVAREMGLAWWDWSKAMGGTCSMVDWAAQTPPLASADHLHLLHAGYRRTAEALFADMMRGYERSAPGAARN